MKMFQLGLTRNQIVQLIKSETSFYAHALALLYLRYVIDPKDLWSWFEKEVGCGVWGVGCGVGGGGCVMCDV